MVALLPYATVGASIQKNFLIVWSQQDHSGTTAGLKE
jgi:hypothetical protein